MRGPRSQHPQHWRGGRGGERARSPGLQGSWWWRRWQRYRRYLTQVQDPPRGLSWQGDLPTFLPSDSPGCSTPGSHLSTPPNPAQGSRLKAQEPGNLPSPTGSREEMGSHMGLLWRGRPQTPHHPKIRTEALGGRDPGDPASGTPSSSSTHFMPTPCTPHTGNQSDPGIQVADANLPNL